MDGCFHGMAPFQFRAQFWAQLADFRLFRATGYFCNILMYRELAWLLGRDLNPRLLGSSPTGPPARYRPSSMLGRVLPHLSSTVAIAFQLSADLSFRENHPLHLG